MKKSIIIIFAFFAVTSCLEPLHRDDNLYPSAVYFINSGVVSTQVMYDCQTTVDVPVYAYCGGYYGGNPEVNVSLDTDALGKYNSENLTSYKLLPEDCYTLDASNKKMTDKKATFILTFDIEKLKELSAETDYSDLDSMAVPLRIKPLSSEVTPARDDNNNITLITPDLRQMSIKIDEEGSGSLAYEDLEKTGDGKIILKYTVRTLVENQWDNEVDFQFNIGDTTSAGIPLPQGSYQVQASAEKFTPGVSEIVYTVTVQDDLLRSLLYNIVAKVESKGSFVLEGTGVSQRTLRNGTQYPFAKMRIKGYNSTQNETPGGANAPDNMLNESSTQFWHNSWGQGTGKKSAPWWVTVELEESVSLIGYIIEERNDGNWSDNKSGYLEVSEDNEAFTRVSTFYFGTQDERLANPEDGRGSQRKISIPEDNQQEAKYVKIAFDASNRSDACNVRLLRLYYK